LAVEVGGFGAAVKKPLANASDLTPIKKCFIISLLYLTILPKGKH